MSTIARLFDRMRAALSPPQDDLPGLPPMPPVLGRGFIKLPGEGRRWKELYRQSKAVFGPTIEEEKMSE